MRKYLLRAGVPLVAGALVLAGVSAAASATVRSHAKPTYTIAFEGPLSGPNSPQLGLNMAGGVKLAINLANQGKTFGALPFKLSYYAGNDQGTPTISPTTAAQIVAKPAIRAVVGPAYSGATKAAEPTFSAAHLATVSPSATAVLLSHSGWKNFFRVVAADNIQGTADADYLVKHLHFTKIYNANDASTYGSGLSYYVAKEGNADHAHVTNTTIPATCGTSVNPSEYGPAAATIAAAKPQVVFYGGYYCDFGLLLNALHGAGYTGKVMSGDGSDDPHLLTSVSSKAYANGVYLTCACAQLGTTTADKAFSSGFQRVAGFKPGTYSAEAYDATNTIIQVMKQIWAKDGAKGETRPNIVAGLHTVVYKGLTKTVRFLANGNNAGHSVYVNQVRGTRIVQLGTE